MPAALFEVYAAKDLPGPLYRIGKSPVFRADNFLSYAALGKPANAPYIQQLGASMYLSLEKARQAAKQLRFRHGSWLAEVELRDERWAAWGLTNPRKGHVEVWAPPEVLAQRVQGVHTAR